MSSSAPGSSRSCRVERLRTQWLRGHVIRTLVAAALFVLTVLAMAA